MSETTDKQALAPELLNDERALRLKRREEFMAEGTNPYPEHSEVRDYAADIEAKYADLADGEDTEDVVKIGGRIVAKRGQGKIMFVVVRDATADIQLFCRINDMIEADWELLGRLDVGDIINVEGVVVRTRRGQLSIAPRQIALLSKSVRPLPEKFHGLSDKETRYRQRYVDLIVNEDVRETFRKRSAIIAAFRRYMEEDGYMEVETPILQTIQGGATAKPFITHFNALNQECYLRIATELHLKRLLVGGFERVYEIGRIFRNEGMDLTHNPEFTTMEAYRAYSDLEGMKKLTEGVVKAANAAVNDSEQIVYQGQEIDLSGEWPSRSMSDIVSEVLGETVTIDTPVEVLAEHAKKHGIEVKPDWTSGKLIAELYDELGEDSIVNPTFVVDYPVEVSPLAKRHEDDPRLTHRFELVIAGHEYANAFSELNDPVDQAERFAKQMEEKAEGDDEAMEYDEDYVRALEYGMPPAGGMGIGIDRVVMLLTDSASIRDVLLFPHMRPEGKGRAGVGAAAAKAKESGAADVFAPNKVPTIDFSKIAVEPLFEDAVDFETFSKSDFRAVKVKDCVAVPKSKKLLQFTLDDGTGEDRTILSGIHAYYEPEELVGKTCIAIVNLPPRKMMGVDSCGMLLSAIHEEEGEERLNLLMVDPSIPAGAKLY
ncbi:MAG TPA: lysine--tRNA ligase [Candidatus Aveggerthella stercoripullorum]|uniref:Lysine--tRNA ligase n=1 Tax=Candidatus Aveggerthella stercoripullorum TaxID=2840688 RepID=A0A9D1A223_9ACTN|nr:lysine--tRNA ligase [Candidatus Aveggerthella stercoripullorum]